MMVMVAVVLAKITEEFSIGKSDDIRIINRSTDVAVSRTNLSLVYCHCQAFLLVNTASAVLLMIDKIRL